MSSLSIEVGAGAIHVGDARALLPTIAPGSCRVAITSPPYWGLRDYTGGDPGEVGREGGVDEYIAALLDTMRLVRSALTKDGTLWLNLGDVHARAGGRGGGFGTSSHSHVKHRMANDGRRKVYPARRFWGGTPEKGLVGLPWRIALLLQQEGWIWRATVPWIKRNGMPESVDDRPVASIEYVLMMSTSEDTYYDVDQVRRPKSEPRVGRYSHLARKRLRNRGGRQDGFTAPGQVTVHPDGRQMRDGDLFFDSMLWALDGEGMVVDEEGRPLALVTNLHGSTEEHTAMFPEVLIDPLVRVSSEPGDTVLDPFFGMGTTGIVAERRHRRWLGIELLPDNAIRAAERIRAAASQLALIPPARESEPPPPEQIPLIG